MVRMKINNQLHNLMPQGHINPDHYKQHPSGVECIQIAEHFTFNIGQVYKYTWRCGLKDSEPVLRDLEKAKWYLEREIQRIQTLPCPKA